MMGQSDSGTRVGSGDGEALADVVANDLIDDRTLDGIRRLLVGCSAGGDSTALLDILYRLRDRLRISLAVAHLHHGWRGREADEDLQAVRAMAEARDLPFFHAGARLESIHGSREEVARRARLGFFEGLAASWPADAVALGHTAEDQLETVLLNLGRGTGRRGLGGMRPRTRVGDLLLVRPLLDCRRAELRTYASARGLAWREDSSNDDISLSRNRLRHRIIGELQQINPGAVGNVARAARLLREEDEWFDTLARQALAEVRDDEGYPGGTALLREPLEALPRPLARRLLHLALAEIRGHRRGLEARHVEWIIDALALGPQEVRGGRLSRDLPGVRVRFEGRRIRLLPLRGRRLEGPRTGRA